MQKKLILLSGALVTTMAFAGCQPQSTAQTDKAMASTAPVAETKTGSEAMMTPAMAAKGVLVGGAMMLPSRTIVANAADASNLSTLVAAVTQAGLVETLSGPGPFTVFAPTNDAFNKVPKATLDSLMTPAKKADLTKILTYHVVPGKYDAASLKDGMKLKTVQGEMLTVSIKTGVVMIMDAKGGKSTVQTADVMQSNGVVHVIDTVLMPM